MAKSKRTKQRSTKHYHKTKDRVTRTPIKIEDELSGSCRFTLVTNPVISHE